MLEIKLLKNFKTYIYYFNVKRFKKPKTLEHVPYTLFE